MLNALDPEFVLSSPVASRLPSFTLHHPNLLQPSSHPVLSSFSLHIPLPYTPAGESIKKMILNELIKSGPLAKIWLSAHQERKLSKTQAMGVDVGESVGK